jgi:flagellar biogenesis protein FliO
VGVRQKIALVRVGTRQVLVGMTPGQFTALASWDTSAHPAGAAVSGPVQQEHLP